MYIKNSNLKKEGGITIKSKWTSNHKKQLYPVLATVTIQSQMHVQIKHSLAHVHLQDLIPTLTDVFWIYILYQPN